MCYILKERSPFDIVFWKRPRIIVIQAVTQNCESQLCEDWKELDTMEEKLRVLHDHMLILHRKGKNPYVCIVMLFSASGVQGGHGECGMGRT